MRLERIAFIPTVRECTRLIVQRLQNRPMPFLPLIPVQNPADDFIKAIKISVSVGASVFAFVTSPKIAIGSLIVIIVLHVKNNN